MLTSSPSQSALLIIYLILSDLINNKYFCYSFISKRVNYSYIHINTHYTI